MSKGSSFSTKSRACLAVEEMEVEEVEEEDKVEVKTEDTLIIIIMGVDLHPLLRRRYGCCLIRGGQV